MVTTSRQRRKQRSGNSTGGSARSKKAAQKKLRRAAPIQGPAAIRDNWDPKATVRQNYQRLGLVGDLSLRDSGGAEKGAANDVARTSSVTQKSAVLAKVERDADGNVISIQEPTKRRKRTAWGEALNSDDEEGSEHDLEAQEGESERTGDAPHTGGHVVTALEKAAESIAPVHRFTSDTESSWLRQLVGKYGADDVEAMSRDRALNVWQKTPGEIRRAIKKAGGPKALE